MKKGIAKYIDHTLLKPSATKEDIEQILDQAKKYGFASVCVNPYWVANCYERLKDTEVKVCTVIGFPLGATTTETKVFETMQAIKNGATEIDMVMNIGELKSGNDVLVKHDMKEVITEADGLALTKVIIETSLLTNDEKSRACKLVKEVGADYVKTSTGFSGGGATADDIKRMLKAVGDEQAVKASGGIRDLEKALEMIEAGASRIGTSSGVEILTSYNMDH